jgi:putative hydrolase of HD superfamily
LQSLLDPLPEPTAARLLGLWDKYDAASTPEVRLARGLDRLETVLQHVQGANDPDFDYGFNLSYGQEHTGAHPLVAALRAPVDEETRRLAGRGHQKS